MPADQITQAEIAALTRRSEEQAEKTGRESGIVKSDLTAVRLQVGNLDQRLGSFVTEQRTANARIIERVSNLVERD